MQSNRHGTIITDSWISKKVRILCSLHPESISKKESKKDDTLVSQHSCNVKSLDADRNIYTDQGVHWSGDVASSNTHDTSSESKKIKTKGKAPSEETNDIKVKLRHIAKIHERNW